MSSRGPLLAIASSRDEGASWTIKEVPNAPLLRFFNIQRDNAGEAVLTGLAVGVGGWLVTIAIALAIALVLQATGVLPKNPQPSATIAWMASLPLWKKIMIVCSAMTVEEAFFRGWLQKRVGLIASTLLFALAHLGLGQPFLLIGVMTISVLILRFIDPTGFIVIPVLFLPLVDVLMKAGISPLVVVAPTTMASSVP